MKSGLKKIMPGAAMTTVSSTSGTPYTAPASSTPAPNVPYDSDAALAQAYQKAADLSAKDSSGSTNSLLGLSQNVIDLLQGGQGGDLMNTLLGASSNNVLNHLFTQSLTKTALYATAHKLGQDNLARHPVDDLVASSNAYLNNPNSVKTPPTDTTA